MPTTVLSLSLTSDDSGDEGESFRNTTQSLSLLAGSLGQVRVTFVASSVAGLITDHCSIGIDKLDGTGSSTVPMVELTFNTGQHGFNIGAGATITSDWVNFSFLITDSLLIVLDFNASSGGSPRRILATAHIYIKAATASYNTQTVTGFAESGFTAGYNLIETQAGSGATFFEFGQPNVHVTRKVSAIAY